MQLVPQQPLERFGFDQVFSSHLSANTASAAAVRNPHSSQCHIGISDDHHVATPEMLIRGGSVRSDCLRMSTLVCNTEQLNFLLCNMGVMMPNIPEPLQSLLDYKGTVATQRGCVG